MPTIQHTISKHVLKSATIKLDEWQTIELLKNEDTHCPHTFTILVHDKCKETDEPYRLVIPDYKVNEFRETILELLG